MSTIYALLTRRCNLTCPYCDVKDVNDNYDHEKFINVLRSFNGGITLFGGEPTLYRYHPRLQLYLLHLMDPFSVDQMSLLLILLLLNVLITLTDVFSMSRTPCYSCDLAGECRPCRLQRYCSFPKKFHNNGPVSVIILNR